MRASAAEYRSLPLRAHELLRDVPLYDVRPWIFLEAAAGGPSRTFVRSSPRRLRAISRLSFTASDISWGGYSVGIDNRCGRKTHFWNASERDRRDSEITPGILDGYFWVLYQFPGEALRETRNRTVHGFICTVLVSNPNGYRLYWGVYVRRVSWLTRPYLVAIEPFRWVLYPAMLRRIRRAWLVAYTGMSRIDTA
jgi:hypothetical protein